MQDNIFLSKIKTFFLHFKWYELTYLTIVLIAITVLSIIVKSSAITIIYSIFGLIYVVLLAAKLKIALLFGLVQVSFYIVQSVLYKNWGEVILNSIVVLPILIASTIMWFLGKDKNNEKVTKTEINSKEWFLVLGIFIIIAVSFYFILDILNTKNTIIASISCAFTASAHYLLLRKSQYMFIFFIGVNVILFILWLLPIVQGGGFAIESLPMLITIIVYNISNIKGIVTWSRQKKIQNSENTKIEDNEIQ